MRYAILLLELKLGTIFKSVRLRTSLKKDSTLRIPNDGIMVLYEIARDF